MTPRGGGWFCAIEHEQAVAAKAAGLLKPRDAILSECFCPLLEEFTGCSSPHATGSRAAKSIDPVLMFNVLVLQK